MAYPYVANIAIACIVLNVVFFCLRVWARLVHTQRLIWADLLVTLSLVFNLGVAALQLAQFLGLSQEPGPPSITSLKLSAFWTPMVYGIASALPKLAVLDVYLSVFTERWARYTLLVTGFVIISNAIVYVPTTITQCTPMAFLWDHSIPGGKCNNVTLHYSLASLPNIVTDLVMLILPIPIVWNLHLERTTKAGVLATFLSGGIGLIASIVRFATFLQWTPASNSTAKIGSASLVETCSYLIAACLLSMRPLVRRFIGSVMSTSSSRSFGYNERQKSEVKASGFESWKLGPREKGWKEVGERMDMGELGMGRGDEGRLELKTVRVGEHEAKFPRRPLPLVSRSSNSLV